MSSPKLVILSSVSAGGGGAHLDAEMKSSDVESVSESVVNSKPKPLILSKGSVVDAPSAGKEDASCEYIPTAKEEQLLEQLAKLKASHAKQLKEAKAQARREAFAAKVPTLKVSAKGCVQINGIRRFPITLYKNEWEKIFGMLPAIKEFIKTNDSQLTSI